MENFDSLNCYTVLLEDLYGFLLILLLAVLASAGVHMVVEHLDFFRFLILSVSVNLLIVRHTSF